MCTADVLTTRDEALVSETHAPSMVWTVYRSAIRTYCHINAVIPGLTEILTIRVSKLSHGAMWVAVRS